MALKRISGIGLVKFQAEKKKKDGIPTSVESLELENSELLFKLAMSESKIETLEEDLSEVLFKVANLEIGGI